MQRSIWWPASAPRRQARSRRPSATWSRAPGLVEDDGGRRHDLAFELGLQRAECEFLTGDVTSAEQHLRILSLRAANVIERCAVACLEADVYFAIQQPERGLSACLECLQQAGLDIPLRASDAEAAIAYDKIFSRLDGIGIDEVAALPSMADAEARRNP